MSRVRVDIKHIINNHIYVSTMNNLTTFIDNNNNISEHEYHDGPSLHTRFIFVSAWILIAFAGIIGNSLVIFVAIRFEKLSNVTNCFIVNLAITDIVFLAFCMPFLVVQYTLDHWYFDQIFCKLLHFTSFLSVLVTVLTLVIMTIDRYIYIVHPFENVKWRKPKTVFLLSLIIWLLSCTFASPFYFNYGVTNETYKQCELLTDENVQKQLRIYTVTLYYFIPLTIILICYARLLYYVYSKENKCKPKTKSNPVKWSKRRRAVTKMVAIVTLVFSLCWLPLTLYILSANFLMHRTAVLYYFKMIANSLAYLNSAVNPIIYAFLNRSFRNNCGSILSKPTCLSFCPKDGDKQQPPQEELSKQLNCNPQAKNRYSNIEKNIIIDNNMQLLSNNIVADDFSDAEYEEQDLDCLSHVIINKMDYNNDYAREHNGNFLITTTTANNRHVTTSL
ncbi:unnamed protein product [Rotaria sp. Silwood1]|nr:unnamed protein product [Rotaria sp. Silwood1]CAF3364725.1 unnamed protein product [Rotaria sp. Silwood1]CAF3379500.1 unnamed protein product [Rotaria sp. Silwood1]CAF4580553.1 unnamed protein product [Rotaria sp. Silwood1]CAF4682712.1 unnamed protein product [Rotaria sp. Silwood1]